MSAVPEYNVIKSIQQYITRILKPRDPAFAISGMKCLLLDKDTKTMVSMVTSMHDILSKQVFLVENLESPQPESVGHMKAIIIARPTKESLARLAEHLKSPKFVEYHLFFTNIVGSDNIKRLADADRMCVVKQVHEFYIDYHAINADLMSIGCKVSLALSRPRQTWGSAETASLARCSQGLLALLLSLKVKPHIRYLASSDAAAHLARSLAQDMGTESELFTFARTPGTPLLLLLDRKEDPVTPLLTQWTYQAMAHELLPGGLAHNRVDLRKVPGISKDLEEAVLSPSDDDFFREHMYEPFWRLGEAVGRASQEYARDKARVTAGMGSGSSVEAIATAAMAMQDLSKKGLSVSKHVAIAGELGRAYEAARLIEQGELEQALASASAGEAPGEHLAAVQTYISRPDVKIEDVQVLRLVMLYALRYERSAPGKVAELRALASQRYALDDALVGELLKYCGAGARSTAELYGEGSGGGAGGFLGGLARNAKGLLGEGFGGGGGGGGGGSGGEAHALQQHVPLLVGLLDKLARGEAAAAKGDMSKAVFPYVGSAEPAAPGKPGLVIVFIVGGATYEEAHKVAEINAGRLALGQRAGGGGGGGGGGGPSAPPFRVILGGSSMLSFQSFTVELMRLAGGGGGGGGGGGAGGGSGGVGFSQ